MFQKAIPVFAQGKEKEKNYHLLLRAKVEDLKGCVLLVTACSFYRLTVNGCFVSFGPARTAKGYARVDGLDLSAYHSEVGNEIVIEVAGYYCGSLSTVKQPSYVVAELKRGEDVLLSTGSDFEGYCSCCRLQKAERFSGQRHFGEIYDYREDNVFSEEYRVSLVPAEKPPVYLPRCVPMPDYEVVCANRYVSAGVFSYDASRPCQNNSYSNGLITPEWGQYEADEAVSLPYRWIQKQKQEKTRGEGTFPLRLSEGEYAIVDMGAIYAGFLCVDVTAHEECDLVLGFSELCSADEFAFTNINMQTVIEYFVSAGKRIECQSFEPYTCRFAVLMVKKGSVTFSSFGVRKYEYRQSLMLRREVRDPELKRIYEAAERTFAHNAVDLFTDCPSRERAGWLCDSYFTGAAEYFLTGKTLIEDAFLENYRLYRNEGETMDGVLPMCYPSDFRQGERKFIPQWNLWYILEVKEYLTQRNRSVDRETFRQSIYGVLGYLAKFENSDGLLEDLPCWNFVEWSTANEWVHNVNYPTNFLYSEALYAAGELYGDGVLTVKAEKVRQTARELAFDGEVFTDNAIRGEDGVLRNTRNSSEACQYYAVLYGGVDWNDARYDKLRTYVKDGFATFVHNGREFVPVNAFIGLYLRICVLMKLGEKDVLREDIKAFFGSMVASTGTLWEYKQLKGSFDHGFASFVALAIDFVENSNKNL